MTTDLEGLAREHEEKAAALDLRADVLEDHGHTDDATAHCEEAQAHRQAAALIRGGGENISDADVSRIIDAFNEGLNLRSSEAFEASRIPAMRAALAALPTPGMTLDPTEAAPAPGREEISNEIHIALQRLHYADLSWIAGSADGFERATLAIADHLLSALFHAPAGAGGGEDELDSRTEAEREAGRAKMRADREGYLASPTPPAGDGWEPIETAPKDGTDVDLWSRVTGRVPDAYFSRPHQAWARKEGFPVVTIIMTALEPSHWRPLPPPPVSKGEK